MSEIVIPSFYSLAIGDTATITYGIYPYLDAKSAVAFSSTCKTIFPLQASLTKQVAEEIIWKCGQWYKHVLPKTWSREQVSTILHLKPDALLYEGIYYITRQTLPHLMLHSIALAKNELIHFDSYAQTLEQRLQPAASSFDLSPLAEALEEIEVGCRTPEKTCFLFLQFLRNAPATPANDTSANDLSFQIAPRLPEPPSAFETQFSRYKNALQLTRAFLSKTSGPNSRTATLPPESLFFLFNFWYLTFRYFYKDSQRMVVNHPEYVIDHGFLVEFDQIFKNIKVALQDNLCWLYLLDEGAFSSPEIRELLHIPDYIAPTLKSTIEFLSIEQKKALDAAHRYPVIGRYFDLEQLQDVHVVAAILEKYPYFYTTVRSLGSFKHHPLILESMARGLLQYPSTAKTDYTVELIKYQFTDEEIQLAQLFGLASAAVLPYAPKALLRDQHFLLEMSRRHPNFLKYCPHTLQNNRPFVLQAIKSNTQAWYWAVQYDSEFYTSMRSLYFSSKDAIAADLITENISLENQLADSIMRDYCCTIL